MEAKKIENCFANAQSYEYRLPFAAEHLANALDESWVVRFNRKLRRPVFRADNGTLQMKGTLAANTIRVGFPKGTWEADKASFEDFLEELISKGEAGLIKGKSEDGGKIC